MAQDRSCCGNGLFDSCLHLDVKDYYGKILRKTSDLKTNACKTPAQPTPAFIRDALMKVHPDVCARYYGCGLVVPLCVEGCRILDLGSGSGRDCYVLSQLVGEDGHVTGIDMTEIQLEVARNYVDYHMNVFGYKKPNVSFVQGYMEALTEAGLEKNSFDIVISNCVVNLSPDKKLVLAEAYSVLKEGGELYFSDIYCSGQLTEEIRNHKVMWGDFKFVSATYRLFKVPKGPPEACRVVYNGGVTGAEDRLRFDCRNTFKANEVVEVDGELANILKCSRFAPDFNFQPPGGSTELCCVNPKADIVDPFELAVELGSQGLSAATGGCCSTKSADCCR